MLSDPCSFLAKEICYREEDNVLSVYCDQQGITISGSNVGYIKITCGHDAQGAKIVVSITWWLAGRTYQEEKEYRGSHIYNAMTAILDLLTLGKLHARMRKKLQEGKK